jgi:hypothetical protein
MSRFKFLRGVLSRIWSGGITGESELLKYVFQALFPKMNRACVIFINIHFRFSG